MQEAKRKGRPRISDEPLTSAERQKRYQQKKKKEAERRQREAEDAYDMGVHGHVSLLELAKQTALLDALHYASGRMAIGVTGSVLEKNNNALECLRFELERRSCKKLCPRCNLQKPFSEFNADSKKPRGLRCECRSCQAIQTRIDSENRRSRLQQSRLQFGQLSLSKKSNDSTMKVKSINGIDVINTSEISALLGISLSVQRIKDSGVEPYAETATAILWKHKDVAEIAIAIADHLLSISDRINEEYKK